MVSELVVRTRVLVKTKHCVAFVPYAASSPLHVMALPKAPRRNLVAATDEEQQDLGEFHQRLAELISTAIESPAASIEVLWSMAPISRCRSISRMRVEYTSADAGVNFEDSPEELALILKAWL
ncbi:HIT domain-containing protein [Rothia sp. ND6WE1A]|nr:HIT domain-containing protein [Rothia sp. ND6WE1A]